MPPVRVPVVADLVSSPWTPEQVAHLEAWQAHGAVHPYTCPNRGDGHHPAEAPLRPTVNGWVCETCEYTQTWAHDFSVNRTVAPWPPRG